MSAVTCSQMNNNSIIYTTINFTVRSGMCRWRHVSVADCLAGRGRWCYISVVDWLAGRGDMWPRVAPFQYM